MNLKQTNIRQKRLGFLLRALFQSLTLVLPYLHDAWRHDRQDEVEPDVGEDAPEGGDEEHPEVFDLATLAFGYRPHADADNDKHVEGGAANDGARP